VSSPSLDEDGRRARRGRNREAVVDAFLELFREGELDPSAALVARRSGVSLRSVYRYFDDVDEMGRIAIQRHAETVRPLFDLPDLGVGSRSVRINGLVAHRLSLYDQVAPVVRATMLRAPFQPVLAAGLELRRTQLHAQIEAHFAAELSPVRAAERRLVVDAIDVLTSFEAVEHLRTSRKLTPRACAALLTTSVDRLLPA
jgi:AcrR family transcriptional regulator